MKVSITGASGFIGSLLVKRLVADGCSVKILSRNPKREFPEGVEVVIGDLSSPSPSLEYFLEGSEVLFHCAGELKNELLMHKVHFDGTNLLINLLRDRHFAGGKKIKWVHLSSVGVYGPAKPNVRCPRIITEDSPPNPYGAYEISKYMSDKLVIEAGRSGILDFAILRPSNIVGISMPNRYVFNLIKFVDKNLFFHIGSPGAISTYVHIDDVIEAMILCSELPSTNGEIYIISSDCFLDDLIKKISFELGCKNPKLRLPVMLIRGVIYLFSGLKSFPLTKRRIDSLVSRTSYSSKKITKDLNFQFKHEFPDAIAEIVAAYQEYKYSPSR
jgi:nucleoside-diphosphate-sugar epimerase